MFIPLYLVVEDRKDLADDDDSDSVGRVSSAMTSYSKSKLLQTVIYSTRASEYIQA